MQRRAISLKRTGIFMRWVGISFLWAGILKRAGISFLRTGIFWRGRAFFEESGHFSSRAVHILLESRNFLLERAFPSREQAFFLEWALFFLRREISSLGGNFQPKSGHKGAGIRERAFSPLSGKMRAGWSKLLLMWETLFSMLQQWHEELAVKGI